MDNHNQPELNWADSISTNIKFFRDQSKLLNDAYNPSQVASGSLMTIIIMNHNMMLIRLKALEDRLENIERLLHDS